MKRQFLGLILVIFFLSIPGVFAAEINDCSDIQGGYEIIEPTTYTVPGTCNVTGDVFTIATDGASLDCIGAGEIIGDGTGKGVFITGADNITVQNCQFSNFEKGIDLLESSNSTIQNNTLTNVEYGITVNWRQLLLEHALNVSILGNRIVSDGTGPMLRGISVDQAEYASVEDNFIEGVFDGGASPYATHFNSISFGDVKADEDNKSTIVRNTLRRLNQESNDDPSNTTEDPFLYISPNSLWVLIYNNNFRFARVAAPSAVDPENYKWYVEPGSPCSGPNIIGGQCIGGNYWGDSWNGVYNPVDEDGDGIADTCTNFNPPGGLCPPLKWGGGRQYISDNHPLTNVPPIVPMEITVEVKDPDHKILVNESIPVGVTCAGYVGPITLTFSTPFGDVVLKDATVECSETENVADYGTSNEFSSSFFLPYRVLGEIPGCDTIECEDYDGFWVEKAASAITDKPSIIGIQAGNIYPGESVGVLFNCDTTVPMTNFGISIINAVTGEEITGLSTECPGSESFNIDLKPGTYKAIGRITSNCANCEEEAIFMVYQPYNITSVPETNPLLVFLVGFGVLFLIRRS